MVTFLSDMLPLVVYFLESSTKLMEGFQVIRIIDFYPIDRVEFRGFVRPWLDGSQRQCNQSLEVHGTHRRGQIFLNHNTCVIEIAFIDSLPDIR